MPAKHNVGLPDTALPTLSAPIPFVTLSDDSAFEIAPEAVVYLKQIRGPVAIVAIAGLYRTGKSYMLNLLLGRDRAAAMFSVGATINACTKGIWIWGQPVQLSSAVELAAESAFKHLPKDTTIVFMDTEGLGSTQRSQTEDTRIFALALLLSSLFIYNSRGVIDSSAIEDLSLVVNLTKFIQAKAHTPSDDPGSDSEGSDLAAFFPDFLWVVRDFTLQLQEEGRKVTPREYFESALKHQPPMTEEIAQKNRIRTLLSTFFPSRDCVTMVRPLNDESLLRSLLSQPFESLRPEFQEQMAVLKAKVFSSLKPKKMMASLLNGPMLVALAQNYVDAFNSGSSPVIASVWDRVVEGQCDEALESAKAAFRRRFEFAAAEAARSDEGPLGEDAMLALYEEARALAEKELELEDASAASVMNPYREQLSEFMLESLGGVYASTKLESTTYNQALLERLVKLRPAASVDSASGAANRDSAQALQDALAASRAFIDDVVTQYRAQAHGSSASAVLAAFLSETLAAELVDWGVAVKASFRTKTGRLDSRVGELKQRLRALEGKTRAGDDFLAQQTQSYERALHSLSQRTADEQSALQDELVATQLAAERTRHEIEQLSALHDEALAHLEAQAAEAKEERKQLEARVQEAHARRENERLEATRLMLESERNFHREEKGLLHSQQQLLQRIIELERVLGAQDAAQMEEIFRLEQASEEQAAKLELQYQDEREELKERAAQELRALKDEQDEQLAALDGELNEQKAQLSALREQLEAKEAIAERKKARAFFGAGEDSDAYDVVLGTLGECLDFLQAADGSDREEEAAQVSQLLGDVLRDKKQRAQVLKMLVDALTQCAEDEDVQFTESVSQAIMYACYASLTRDESDDSMGGICEEVSSALRAALSTLQTDEDAEVSAGGQAATRVLNEVQAMVQAASPENAGVSYAA